MAADARVHSWVHDPVALTVTALAVHRATTLVTVDEFPPAEAARGWLEQHLPADYRHGARCTHCMSWWLAVAATVLATVADQRGHRRAWLLACAPWAISAAIGIVADREPA